MLQGVRDLANLLFNVCKFDIEFLGGLLSEVLEVLLRLLTVLEQVAALLLKMVSFGLESHQFLSLCLLETLFFFLFHMLLIFPVLD